METHHDQQTCNHLILPALALPLSQRCTRCLNAAQDFLAWLPFRGDAAISAPSLQPLVGNLAHEGEADC